MILYGKFMELSMQCVCFAIFHLKFNSLSLRVWHFAYAMRRYFVCVCVWLYVWRWRVCNKIMASKRNPYTLTLAAT